MLDFRPPHKRQLWMGRNERLGLLAVVLAVCLPVIFLVRAGRNAPEPAPLATAPGTAGKQVARTAKPLPPELSVNAAQLDVIRDNTLERPEEREAFLRLLAILRQATPVQLQEASIGRITYAQLQRQPNQYRGKLVTIQGTVRRVNSATAPKNDQGLDHYFQLWIEPADAPSWPIVVVCLELPAGFPVGQQVSADVTITGFFFKRWAYMAQDQLRTAPALLARSVEWEGPSGPGSTPPARPPLPWTSVLIVGAGTIAIGAWLVWHRRPSSHRSKSSAADPDFRTLDDRSSREPDSQ